MPLLGKDMEANVPGHRDEDSESGSSCATVPAVEVMPIAIVGMACRFPGEASSPEGLWNMCCSGRSAWSEIPKDRMNVDGFWHPNIAKPGCFNNRGGHFLKKDLGLFDAPFFRINASEAKAMDPQQRLLLECTYEALENAGVPVHRIAGKRVGVYIGLASTDYSFLAHGDESIASTYTATGLAPTLASNRLSYCFDLRGPSMTIDTACSSSLTALHLACQSLRTGETKQAIVGGSHLVLSPDVMTSMSLLGLFSNDGRSYTYDNRSSGYGRGEGVAAILVKPLHDAIEAGDNIRAIIRNTGANQDGRTPGVTFPSQEAQIDLMKSVYRAAGLDCAQTAYVEAHGTGTAVGDPIEAEAIATVFGSTRSTDDPVIVGSVKTNIGHTESASGLAGIIKTVYMLEEGLIPPNINFENSHERIYLRDWNMKVPTSLLPWPESSVRRASVCNFGFGGTNGHVILESSSSYLAANQIKIQDGFTNTNCTPSTTSLDRKLDHNGFTNQNHSQRALIFNGNGVCNGFTNNDQDIKTSPNSRKTKYGSTNGGPAAMNPPQRAQVYVLSAFEKGSSISQIKSLHAYLNKRAQEDSPRLMQDLAFTLNNRRSLYTWRVAIPASSQKELIERLADNDVQPSKVSIAPRLAFIFTGQGAQWAAMGRELMRDYPIYASTIHEAESCLKGLGAKWSLLDELQKDTDASLLTRAYISQPAVTALQIALVNLLSSWGIKPVAVCGHSSGEIPAAYACGALSMTACLAIAYHRGVIAWTLESSASDNKGAMLALRASSEEVTAMLTSVKSGRVDIACYLSPSLIVASGDDRAIDELQSLSKGRDVLTTKLHVNVAYHSHHMRAVEIEYLAALGHINHQASADAEFWSSSRGHRVKTETLDSSYWVDNMVNPVMLSQTLQKLCFPSKSMQAEGVIDALVEIGPHTSFESPVKQIIKANMASGNKIKYMHTLQRGKDATQTMLGLIANLWEMGCEVNLAAVNFPEGYCHAKTLVDLPTYPWMHNKRHWNESRMSYAHRMKPFPRHDLIGSMELDSNSMDHQWRNIFRLEEIPWLLDHKIESNPVFPFSGFMAMVIQASYQRAICRDTPITDSTRYNLREISVLRSLVFQESSSVEVHITLRPNHEGTQRHSSVWDDFSISSWTEEQGWIEHCRGLVSVKNSKEPNIIDGKRTDEDERSALTKWASEMRNVCTASLDCKSTYDIWAKGGLLFGPAYRNIYEAYTYPGKAVVSLRVPETASRMPCSWESESVIHPATLDTILQAVMYALPAEDHEFVNGYLPVFMKSLSVSHGITHIPGDSLQVYATARFSDGKKMYIGTMTVLDLSKDTGLPVLEVGDYTGSATSNQAGSPMEADNSRNLCFKFKWEPYLDSLLPPQLDQLLPIAESKFQELNGPSLVEEVMKLGYAKAAFIADKLAHQNPNMKILQIGGKTADGAILILEALLGMEGSQPRFSCYDFTEVSLPLLEEAQSKLEGWGGLAMTKKLDIEQDPTEQGFTAGSYDLVVCVNAGLNPSCIDLSMRHIQKILRVGGKLILSAFRSQTPSDFVISGTLSETLSVMSDSEEKPAATEEQWDDILRQTGFSGVDNGVLGQTDMPDYSPRVMLSTAVSADNVDYPDVTIVLGSPHPNGISLESLQVSLKDLTGSAPAMTTLTQSKTDDACCVILDTNEPLLFNITEEQFAPLQNMCSRAKGILWVVRGASYGSTVPDANMTLGFARTIRSENTALKFVTLDLDSHGTRSDIETAETIVRIFKTAFGSNTQAYNCDVEFAERNGIVQIPRLITDAEKDNFMHETQPHVPESQPFLQSNRPLRLSMKTPGLLDSLYFTDDTRLAHPIGEIMLDIDVKAVGMNFKDVMIGLGQIPYEDLGFECSGVVTAVGKSVSSFAVGDRVCTMAGGCYANQIRVADFTVQKIPDDMTFTTAASILTIFTTAHYSLFNVARLQQGESILIHAAAGGVGQAATMLAQRIGAEIFITVGSTEKKNFMMDTYHIPEDHIFSSRDTTFERGIIRKTQGEGVDVILNSVASEALRLTWNCLAPLGRFIEVGKKDMVQNSRLEMRKFLAMATFASVDLAIVIQKKPEVFQKTCADVMELLRTGAVKPVSPITVYPMSKIESALRLMQTGKHMGKIVVEAQSSDHVRAIPAKVHISAIHADASYLITGGTGGLGRSTVRWLVKQGARNIILVSRSGAAQQNVRELIEDMAMVGAKVSVHKCDVADRDQLEAVINESARTMPPICGVIHGVMVLRDSIFELSTYADYTAVTNPKVRGAWNLHNILSTQPLTFFILLSSISGIAGTRGQATYAAASTFLDAFAAYRTSQGLPATSIDLGVVADVGYVAENKDRQAQITANANDQIKEGEYHALLKAAICGVGGREAAQTITGCKLAAPRQGKTSWTSTDPIWSLLARASSNITQSPSTTSTNTPHNMSITTALSLLTSPIAGQQLICSAIVTKFANIGSIPDAEGIEAGDFDTSKSLVSYGLDSLVAIELRNWLARSMEAAVPMLRLLGGVSVWALAGEVLRSSRLVDQRIFGEEAEGEGEGEGEGERRGRGE